MLRGDEITAATLEAAFAAIEREATAYSRPRPARAAVTVTRYADVRYAGQAYELSVPVPPGRSTSTGSSPTSSRSTSAPTATARGRSRRRRLDPRARARRAHRRAQMYDPLAAIRALPALRGHAARLLRPRTSGSSRHRSATGPACSRGERRGPAPRRRGRLDLRRAARLRRPARRLRQHRGRARCLSRECHRPDHPRGGQERARVDGGRDGARDHAQRLLARSSATRWTTRRRSATATAASSRRA